jgi:hypothetical protein
LTAPGSPSSPPASKQCLLESNGQDTLDTKTMEKLFLSLA